MVTLYSYILRELLKTMGLAALALTALFTMGGGLFNVIHFESVSAADVVGFLPLLIPVVLTMCLPIAALFAATMVYGRLAADNELTACRAAGISIHRLFLPAFLVSIFVAAFTLLFGNFVIPSFVQQIGQNVRANLRDMVYQHLQNEGFIHHRDKDRGAQYTLTADRVEGVTDEALREAGFETGTGLQYLLITNPTFLHIDAHGKLVRFTVARHGVVLFDTRNTPVEMTLDVGQARDFEIGRSAAFVGQQTIGPVAVPLPSPFKLSTADLRSLLAWYAAPWDAPRLCDQVQLFMLAFAEQRFFDFCAAQLTNGSELVLTDDAGHEYRLSGARVRNDGRSLKLDDARVAVQEPGQSLPTRYEAAELELKTTPLPREIVAHINLLQTADRDVLEYDPRGGHYTEPRRRPTLSLDGLQIPTAVATEMAGYTAATIVDPKVELPTGEWLADRRVGLTKECARMGRRVAATIHFRLGYTTCALVIVTMGAALGVIFRGNRALAAFALAMIPLFSVMILMVLGRQLSEDAHTTQIGPFVTWGGLAAVAVADIFLLRLGVRR